MQPRRRGSILLWQTGLFIVVIIVAMLILSGSLSAGLQDTLARIAETNELRNASALAQRLQPEFPLAVDGSSRIKDLVAEYRDIYGSGIWVYNANGELIEAAFDVPPVDAVLESAKIAGLEQDPSYAVSDLRADGSVVASKPLIDENGELDGVVVTASTVDQHVAILNAVRDRLWITFWVSLAVAGLLGFAFAELIARRIRAMSDAASAVAAGDFDQRVSAGVSPDEIQDLAELYNSMAARLGEAFGEIEESRRRIVAVVESMAEGVVGLDADARVRVANPEALRLLGSEGDAIGLPIDRIGVTPEVLEIVNAGLAGDSAAGTVTLGRHIVMLHSTPLVGAQGEAEGAVLLLADVTEQHRIEDAQRRFVADASHEMRTPIAALKGMLELLEDGAKEKPEVRDDFIHTMQVEADRLSRLVADLLTLAQLEAGSLRLRLGPEYAADLLGEVAGVMRPLAEQAGVTLAVEVPEAETRVIADRDKIVQVLLSFTDNALKHSEADTTIHLRAIRDGDEVRLEVADEGTGIEADELSRVFERFYRADAARAGGGGTGLGLAIAKEIVEAHQSSIDVRSEPGSGTAFSFTLQPA